MFMVLVGAKPWRTKRRFRFIESFIFFNTVRNSRVYVHMRHRSIFHTMTSRTNDKKKEKKYIGLIGGRDEIRTRNFGVVVQLTETNLIAVTISDIDLTGSSNDPAFWLNILRIFSYFANFNVEQMTQRNHVTRSTIFLLANFHFRSKFSQKLKFKRKSN